MIIHIFYIKKMFFCKILQAFEFRIFPLLADDATILIQCISIRVLLFTLLCLFILFYDTSSCKNFFTAARCLNMEQPCRPLTRNLQKVREKV